MADDGLDMNMSIKTRAHGTRRMRATSMIPRVERSGGTRTECELSSRVAHAGTQRATPRGHGPCTGPSVSDPEMSRERASRQPIGLKGRAREGGAGAGWGASRPDSQRLTTAAVKSALNRPAHEALGPPVTGHDHPPCEGPGARATRLHRLYQLMTGR
jgi:hypothetical protein